MSENENQDELFDAWLAANLKTPSQINPAFTQKLVHKMERLNAQKILRRVLLQKRFAVVLFFSLLAGLIGLLCCPPVPSRIHALLETTFTGFIHLLLRLQPEYFPVLISGAILLLLLIRSVWKSLTSDS
jgi:hypothetical protein